MAASKPLTGWLKRVDLRGLRIRLVDGEGEVVGRLASKVSTILQGKDKPAYAPNRDDGDVVVVVNANALSFTGNKWNDKLYRWHTGWPGGLKEFTAQQVKEKHGAADLLRRAVRGMLPKNKLRDRRMRKLLIYDGPDHDFNDEYLWKFDMPARQLRDKGVGWQLPDGFTPMNPHAYWQLHRASDAEWQTKLAATTRDRRQQRVDAADGTAALKVDMQGERLQ